MPIFSYGPISVEPRKIVTREKVKVKLVTELSREELIDLNDKLQDRVVQLENNHEKLLDMLDGSDNWPLSSVRERLKKVFTYVSKEMYDE